MRPLSIMPIALLLALGCAGTPTHADARMPRGNPGAAALAVGPVSARPGIELSADQARLIQRGLVDALARTSAFGAVDPIYDAHVVDAAQRGYAMLLMPEVTHVAIEEGPRPLVFYPSLALGLGTGLAAGWIRDRSFEIRLSLRIEIRDVGTPHAVLGTETWLASEQLRLSFVDRSSAWAWPLLLVLPPGLCPWSDDDVLAQAIPSALRSGAEALSHSVHEQFPKLLDHGAIARAAERIAAKVVEQFDPLHRGIRIVVDDFDVDVDGARGAPLGRDIAHRVREFITRGGTARLVTRKELDRVLEEQGLQSSAMCDKRTACQLGRLLGATWIVRGTVVPSGEAYKVEVRLLRVETSDLIEFSEPLGRDADVERRLQRLSSGL